MSSSELVSPLRVGSQYNNGGLRLCTFVFDDDTTGATYFGFPRSAGLWAITNPDGRVLPDPYLERYPFSRRLAQTAFNSYENTGDPRYLGKIIALITEMQQPTALHREYTAIHDETAEAAAGSEYTGIGSGGD